MKEHLEQVRNEELQVGDTVEFLGQYRRIVEIRPYNGPYDFIFGIAETVLGCGFSLEKGGWTTRVKRENHR